MLQYERLINEFGTPLYVMDTESVSRRYRELKTKLEEFTIKYACKANYHPLALQAIQKEDGQFVAGSAEEAMYATEHGIKPQNLQVTAVCPRSSSIDRLVELGDRCEQFTTTVNELDTVKRLVRDGYSGRILLRLKPADASKSSKYSNGSGMKFGMTEDEIQASIDILQDSEATIDGFHSHMGGSFLNKDMSDFLEHVRSTVKRARKYIPIDEMNVLNLGGGMGVPYKPEEESLNLNALRTALTDTLPESSAEYVLEPGRYVVAPTTVMLTEVRATRDEENGRFVGVDAGMAEFPRPTMFDVYHGISNVTGDGSEVEQTVAGPTCSGADIFCHQRGFTRAMVGDILAVEDIGAYGTVMSSRFHRYEMPETVSTEGEVAENNV